jgi:hypothetical protein
MALNRLPIANSCEVAVLEQAQKINFGILRETLDKPVLVLHQCSQRSTLCCPPPQTMPGKCTAVNPPLASKRVRMDFTSFVLG